MQDDAKRVKNVVDLHRVRSERLILDAQDDRPQRTTSRRFKSKADKLDILTAVDVAQRRLVVVAGSDELRPVLAFAIDGAQSDDRADQQEKLFEILFADVALLTSPDKIPDFALPEFVFALANGDDNLANAIPEGAYSAFVSDVAGQRSVLLSATLGFNELQVAVLDGIAQTLVEHANSIGIKTIWNNAASRVARVIAGEWIERLSGVQLETESSQPVRFAGRSILADVRRPG